MIDALSTATRGLNQAIQNFNTTSNRLAEGELDSKTVVDSKIAQRDVEAQLVSIRAISETEETALDLLA